MCINVIVYVYMRARTSACYYACCITLKARACMQVVRELVQVACELFMHITYFNQKHRTENKYHNSKINKNYSLMQKID